MALLRVLDDGSDDGEVIRVRAASFVIGRVEGDLIIPHDAGISGRHAEISRRFENGLYHWYLRDLQSTNGTFVRAANVLLTPNQELLIGSRRFRFQPPTAPHDPSTAAAAGQASPGTRKFVAPTPGDRAAMHPALVEVSASGQERSFALTQSEHWIGRDPSVCSIVVDDPMIDRKHLRIHRDATNRWVATNAQSLNGLWARIQELRLGRGALFQCGEQQFLFEVL
jgi:pSer/pThr/pTyr-binding forkhead associated (FHA) protein